MITFDKCKYFKGEITVPADKSITHRAIIMSSMAHGVSLIKNPLLSRDTLATLNAFKMLGCSVTENKNEIVISSDGAKSFKEPNSVIDCENAGTAVRLITGVLAPQPFYTVLTGDNSLRKRPMDRVIKPLSELGARIFGREQNRKLPITILPSPKMTGANITAQVKSAQVKSAVLLAAAQIESETTYSEATKTRDHTERMLKNYGVDISVDNGSIKILGGPDMTASECSVPGDFSSAAFFIIAGLMFEGSEVLIKNCGLNPSRTGLLTTLKELGADITVDMKATDPEPVGDIYVKYKKFAGGKISGDITANMIDELPALAMLALFSENPIEIRDAKELRAKESDRLSAISTNFKALGAEVEEYDDGIKVYPLGRDVDKCVLKSFDDHRICMLNVLLAKKFGEKVIVDDISSLDVSFPNFLECVVLLEEN